MVGNQYGLVQLMVADTIYLPATVLKPRPTPEQFARDFANVPVPDDAYEIARKIRVPLPVGCYFKALLVMAEKPPECK